MKYHFVRCMKSNPPEFNCELCEKRFQCRTGLVWHLKKTHKVREGWGGKKRERVRERERGREGEEREEGEREREGGRGRERLNKYIIYVVLQKTLTYACGMHNIV